MKRLSMIVCMLFWALPAMAGEGKSVTYSVGEKSYEGYYISAAEKAPLVILIHDWDGLTDYEIKRSQMLADLGYSVFAIDLFGSGVRPTEVTEMRALTGALYQDRATMRELMNGALAQAKKLGAQTDNAVVAGYCFGGAATLEWARSGVPFKGFVTFHGGLTTPDGQTYANAKGSFLILHGTADQAVPIEQFAQLAKELEQQGLPHEMITYSGARHAFSVFDGNRYHPEADRKSWASFTGYLKETLMDS